MGHSQGHGSSESCVTPVSVVWTKQVWSGLGHSPRLWSGQELVTSSVCRWARARSPSGAVLRTRRGHSCYLCDGSGATVGLWGTCPHAMRAVPWAPVAYGAVGAAAFSDTGN